jgi:hypothetical protein
MQLLNTVTVQQLRAALCEHLGLSVRADLMGPVLYLELCGRSLNFNDADTIEQVCGCASL